MHSSIDKITSAAWQDVPRTLAILSEPLTPCATWRVMWPFGALTQHGFVADWIPASKYDVIEAALKSERYNTVVTPRFVFQEPELFANLVRSKHMRWIFETDDDLFSPESIYRQMTITPEDKAIQDQLEENRQLGLRTLRLVDGITVSSEPLADVLRQFTETPIQVVPNFINIQVFKTNLAGKTRTIPPLTIGWSGGQRSDTDFAVLLEVWPILAQRYPDVHFVVFGYECQALIDCVPSERITFLPGVDYDSYPGHLLNIDIACCVVEDNRWNACKTGVKFWEASLAGAACVVSEALYGRYARHQETAMVASAASEWMDALSTLIEQPATRTRLVRQAQKDIIQRHSIEQHWMSWLGAWIPDAVPQLVKT